MNKVKLLVAPLVMVGFMFATASVSFAAGHPTYGGGVFPPPPLTSHLYSAPNLGGMLQMTMAASSTSDIVSQLNGVTDQVQNGIGILVQAAAIGLGVILGSVLAITWLPRLVRRFFPKGG